MKQKIKILLVRPKFTTIIANLEPLGLEYIMGLCNDLEVECEIFDEFQYPYFNRMNRLTNKIKKGGFNYIGFNANANTVDYILETAKKLKKRLDNINIWVGGPEAEMNYKDFCTESIDMVYYDNGLQTMKNLILGGFEEAVMDEQNGICFKKNGEWVFKKKGPAVDDFICKPDRTAFYQGLKKNFIFLKGSYALSKASFSCPFNCSFCYCTKMNSDVYTERDIMKVVDEIEEIDHPRIWFVDDTFFVDKKRVKMFCDEIIKRGIKKQFMAYARADFLAENPDNILALAYEAGFRDIMVGLEAISDEQLNEYNKQTSRNENIIAIKNLHDNNLVCNALFVVSHTSTKQDFRNLIKFIRENNLLWVVFGIFTPYKGTDAYDEYKDRVIKFKSKRLDGIHITIKPEHMSSFMFMFRVYWLHVLTYPKVMCRALFKTAYDTKRKGWF